MSATGRGAERRTEDFYETPWSAIRDFLPTLARELPLGGHWLEPCAGDGAIVNYLNDADPDRASKTIWDLCELRPGAAEPLLRLAQRHPSVDMLTVGEDYLTWEAPRHYDVAITNPPYKLAREVITKMRLEADFAVALVRLNFLGSLKRSHWFAGDEPDVYVLSQRPSFTEGGTDATEYAWMVWREHPHREVRAPRIRVLPPRPEG
jgi:hypothetical protein